MTKKTLHFPAHQRFSKAELITWAVQQGIELELQGICRCVLMVLCHHAGYRSRECWPSVQTIAKETGFSVRAVLRCTDALEDAKLIRRIRRARPLGQGGRQSNGYRIMISREHLTQAEIVENRQIHADMHSIQAAERMFSQHVNKSVDNQSKRGERQGWLSDSQALNPKPVDKGPEATDSKASGKISQRGLSDSQALKQIRGTDHPKHASAWLPLITPVDNDK